MTDFIRQVGHHIRVRLSQILILVRVLGDIEKEVSDLDRRKACFDSLNQLPFVIECRHVDRIFKGRLRNKEQELFPRDGFSVC